MSKKENEVSVSLELLKEMKKLIKHSNPNNFLMTIPEAAERLSLTANTVYELIDSGQIQALKIRKLRISNAEINRFINENYGKDLTSLVK
nr:helix-turn-helix domain-containing protein [uncultured Romboutsia sp.]